MSVAFCVDEHVYGAIIQGLRRRGVEVLTVQDDGFDHNDDPILLDRALANFGAEIKDVRPMLQRSVAIAIEQFWSGSGERLATVIEEHPRSKLSLTISSNFRRTARLSARCKIRP